MKKSRIYVIANRITRELSPLFIASCRAVAERIFAQFVEKLAKKDNPAEYDMVKVGDFFSEDDFEVDDWLPHIERTETVVEANGMAFVDINEEARNYVP